MSDAGVAAALTAGGAILLAGLNHLLTRGRSRIDVATQLREELRKDNAELRRQIIEVQKDLIDWKNKCYALLESQGKLQVENADMKADIARLTQLLKDHNIPV